MKVETFLVLGDNKGQGVFFVGHDIIHAPIWREVENNGYVYSQTLIEILRETGVVQPFLVQVIGGESVDDIFTPSFEIVTIISNQEDVKFSMLILSEIVVKKGRFYCPVGVPNPHVGGIASREHEMQWPA